MDDFSGRRVHSATSGNTVIAYSIPDIGQSGKAYRLTYQVNFSEYLPLVAPIPPL